MATHKLKHTDGYRALADELRGKDGVVYANAKLESPDGDGSYVEYIRGKDLARYLRAKPEKMEKLVKAAGQGRDVEDQIRDLVHFFIHRALLIKAERKHKKPKPGRTALVKYPRTLLLCQDQSWDESHFYAWRYDRPTSLWYYVAVCLVPLLVVGACLFPLAPLAVRLGTVYVLAGIVTIILGVLLLRTVVHWVVWSLTGYELLLWPNLMDERVGLVDAFSPLVSLEPPPKEAKGQWKQRLLAGVVLAGVVWVLYAHHPDLDTIKDEAQKAHDNLADYLDLRGKNKAFLTGNNASNGTAGAGAGGNAGPGSGSGRQDL
uniref:Translocation protein SEC62 n=1 Tax=Chlamydomonas euryale TaxID=1486919 RepID=A0A7R9YZA1_9CHLO